jgi:hypothetical protein
MIIGSIVAFIFKYMSELTIFISKHLLILMIAIVSFIIFGFKK